MYRVPTPVAVSFFTFQANAATIDLAGLSPTPAYRAAVKAAEGPEANRAVIPGFQTGISITALFVGVAFADMTIGNGHYVTLSAPIQTVPHYNPTLPGSGVRNQAKSVIRWEISGLRIRLWVRLRGAIRPELLHRAIFRHQE